MYRNILVIISIGLSALAAAFIIGELYLAAVNKPADYLWGWRYQGEEPDETNQLGFRGRQISYDKNDYVILLVGDSQVVSSYSFFYRIPEKRLEHHLSAAADRSFRVFSLAARGYGQDQQLLALKDYFDKYRADLVVVWETPENDVWNNMFPTHWPEDGTPKPTFWLDDNNNMKGPINRYSRSRIITLINYTLGFGRSLDASWEKEYLPPAYLPLASYSGDVLEDWYILDTLNENIENEKTHVGLSLVPVSERSKYGITLTNKLLMTMKQVSDANKSGFMAFTVERPDFPLKDGVYKLTRGSGTIYPMLSRKQYRDNVRSMNKNIDYLAVPVTVEKFMNDPDPHLNDRAVDQVMKDLSVEIKKRIDVSIRL